MKKKVIILNSVIIIVILSVLLWLAFGFYNGNYNLNLMNKELKGAYIFAEIAVLLLSPMFAIGIDLYDEGM